jgi:hypothetical protein
LAHVPGVRQKPEPRVHSPSVAAVLGFVSRRDEQRQGIRHDFGNTWQTAAYSPSTYISPPPGRRREADSFRSQHRNSRTADSDPAQFWMTVEAT